MPLDKKRFRIELPPWYERRLVLWGKVKGQSRNMLAANVLQARIEANWAEVDSQINEIAASQGISREELEVQWLGEAEDEE